MIGMIRPKGLSFLKINPMQGENALHIAGYTLLLLTLGVLLLHPSLPILSGLGNLLGMHWAYRAAERPGLSLNFALLILSGLLLYGSLL
jgi:hypothetical protein